MRSFSVLVVVGLVALATGYLVPEKQVKPITKEYLLKQKAVFDLLQHVPQNEVHPELYDLAKQYQFEQHFDDYNNVEFVKQFLLQFKTSFLPMSDIFTLYNEEHLKDMKLFYQVLYSAKTWETFYKTAVWGRFYLNKGLFLNAFTVAFLQRPDTADLKLPAIYEVFPWYFFNSETIQKAQIYKMQGFQGLKKVEDIYTVTIPTNYTYVSTLDEYEQKLSYYREDVQLNSAFFFLEAEYPFWLGGETYQMYKDRRGERWLNLLQQHLARYFLERLSNDLGEIPELSLDEPIEVGYNPLLRYYSGAQFPVRQDDYVCYNNPRYYYAYDKLVNYIHRIENAIDIGYVLLPDGKHVDLTKPESIDILGNLIQGNFDSLNLRYYGNVAYLSKQILGGVYGDHGKYEEHVPSVLNHFATESRDPVSFQLYKNILKFYYQFKNHLQSYTYNELVYQGVKIESVDVDKLITYFDKFDSDITNAVNVQGFDEKFPKTTKLQTFGRISHHNGEDFVINARQWRLNHVPFTVKLNVMAETAGPSVVRVFLGPKYDVVGHMYDVTDRDNWFMLDMFKYDLVAGKNIIKRDSNDMFAYVNDRTTYLDYYKWMMYAETPDAHVPADIYQSYGGIPSRLMLPKGKKGGMPFQMYFIISPYVAPKPVEKSNLLNDSAYGFHQRYLDALPLGFPFDRQIDQTVWFTPNMFYQDVFIFHKTENEVNAVHTQ